MVEIIATLLGGLNLSSQILIILLGAWLLWRIFIFYTKTSQSIENYQAMNIKTQRIVKN